MSAHARSEALLEKVELLGTAMMGLNFRAQAEVLDAEADVWPVVSLAGDVRTEMQALDEEIQRLEYPRVTVLPGGRTS